MNAAKENKKINKSPLHSITIQIAGLFIVTLIFTVVFIIGINGVFLEKFFINNKKNVLLQASSNLEQVLDAYNESILTEEDIIIPDDVKNYCTAKNLEWIIEDTEGMIVATMCKDEEEMQGRLFGYNTGVMDNLKEEIKVLDRSSDYTIQMVKDDNGDPDFIDMFGYLSNGYSYLLRTPMDNIRESVRNVTRFLAGISVIAALLSMAIIGFLTARVTKPINELTDISQHMSDLDFDRRYTGHAGNEIDVLGDNFNRMCTTLESTITELKNANATLVADVENKTRLDEKRKEFIDNVSHELKTPISLIQGYAEGLKEGISEDPESREFYCDVIIDESMKMNQLVRSLLTLNSLESGKDQPVMERFDIVSLVNDVKNSMDIIFSQNNIKLHLDYDANSPIYVWADEFKIEQVLTNYINNAINHLDGDRTIDIRILKEDKRVLVSVFNSGNPIPEKDLPYLWDKFYKVDKARTRAYGGSGIGLSIVKAIMEAHQQEYGVTNYDNGVAFYFTLSRI